MTARSGVILLLSLAAAVIWPAALGDAAQQALTADQEQLLELVRSVHGLDEARAGRLRAILAASRFIGRGNPEVSEHPATPAQCRIQLGRLGVQYAEPEAERICGSPYMAPLYDPRTEQPGDARVCIDRFEFPDVPCEYPVVWVRAREAAEICSAMGKRLCDAHEWEGACAGALEPPDYRFDLAAGIAPEIAFERLQAEHNARSSTSRSWAYGPEYREGVCAAASVKSPDCDGGGWSQCGSNTYPTGMFPECRSTLGVHDQHGNAAEHMNLPLAADQMASAGSVTLGYTEMKGSWFIWDRYRAHPDWCRWRAPYWHGSRVMAQDSHHNYHLGFRCCKDLSERR